MLKKQMNSSKNRLNLLALVVLSSGLVACSVSPPQQAPVAAVATAQTVLSPDLAQKTLIQELNNQSVKVFQVGATVTLVLPSDLVFHPHSANLNQNYLPTLDKISDFMSTYKKEDVSVHAYTDNAATAQWDKALSTRQAQVLINYLWSRGTDSRLMYAIGKGHFDPVAANTSVNGMADNRRIEIRFKFYPEEKGWN